MRKRSKRKILCFSLGMILTVCLTGCSTASKDEQVQTYAWPIATASPEDSVTQILAE